MLPHEHRTILNRLIAGFLLVVSLAFCTAANDAPYSFEGANRHYEQGKYAEAAEIYENMIKGGRPSAAVYFNLGNAYFKNGDLGRALYNYRMAERLSPRDPDIQANLRFARERVPDTVSISSSTGERLIRYFTINELAKFSALLFWIWAGLICLGRLRPSIAPRIRGIGLAVGSILAATVILLLAAINISRGRIAIVVADGKTPIHLGPLAESQASFTADDGSELELLARRDDWLQVRDRMNRSGWIQSSNVLVFPPAR